LGLWKVPSWAKTAAPIGSSCRAGDLSRQKRPGAEAVPYGSDPGKTRIAAQLGRLARGLLLILSGKTPSAVKMTPDPENKDLVLWR
jgi:hypothetical protein